MARRRRTEEEITIFWWDIFHFIAQNPRLQIADAPIRELIHELEKHYNEGFLGETTEELTFQKNLLLKILNASLRGNIKELDRHAILAINSYQCLPKIFDKWTTTILAVYVVSLISIFIPPLTFVAVWVFLAALYSYMFKFGYELVTASRKTSNVRNKIGTLSDELCLNYAQERPQEYEDFGKDPNLEPHNIKELAAKIVATSSKHLVTIENFNDLVFQYCLPLNIKPDYDFIHNQLLNTRVIINGYFNSSFYKLRHYCQGFVNELLQQYPDPVNNAVEPRFTAAAHA